MQKITKEDGLSTDIIGENAAALKKLFPDAFTEHGINFEILRQLLGDEKIIDEGEEKFGLNWHGKKKARQIALAPSLGTLKPRVTDSRNWDNTKNIFIEGDNLEVLKILQKSYGGQVDLIYIDPPYNTGKEFVYPDKFQDHLNTYLQYTGQIDGDGLKLSSNTEASGRRHTNWLNMMYPRLKVAKNLLSSKGIVFISIDENELINLKYICDEIFGAQNFIECVIWNKRIPKNDKGIGNIHEYILLYAKNTDLKHEFKMRKDGLDEIFELVLKLSRKKTPFSDAEREIKKLYKKNGYDRGITLYNTLSEDYELWGKINMSWPNANTFGPTYEVLHPSTRKPVKIPDRGWRWKEDTFNEAAGLSNGEYKEIKKLHDGSFMCNRIWFAKDENTQPSSVTYLKDVDKFLLRSILSLKSDGGVEVEKLFEGKNFFSYPKPTNLLKTLIDSVDLQENSIIMDFFAGASTTADAVIKLSEEGIKKLRFIMIQLPEQLNDNSEAKKAGFENLAELSRLRIDRVGNNVVNRESVDIGFRAFELSSSSIKIWNPDRSDLEETLLEHKESIIFGRQEIDVLFELMLKRGIDLSAKIETKTVNEKTVYSVENGNLFACLSVEIKREDADLLANEILKWHSELKPENTQVFFRDSAFNDNNVTKSNIVAILEQNGIHHVRSL